MRYEKYMIEVKNSVNNPTANAIQAAAEKLFLENGYKTTTTRDIASAAGVALGLIPYYFKSKENLAKSVYFDLRERLYRQVEDVNLDNLSSAECLYVINLLLWQYADQDPNYSKFFYTLLATTDIGDHPSQTFQELAHRVILQYGLEVSDHDNLLYLTVLIGAEKHLTLKRHLNELNISYVEIANLLVSNYLFNIGLPDSEIAKIISNSTAFLKSLTERKMQT